MTANATPGLGFQGKEALVMAALEDDAETLPACPARDAEQVAGRTPAPVSLDRRDWGR